MCFRSQPSNFISRYTYMYAITDKNVVQWHSVSGNAGFIQIFAGIHRKRGVKWERAGWSETEIFSAFGRCIFATFREKAKTNKKAQLTQGLRATAPSFQDRGCFKMAVSRHLGFYRTANSAIRSAEPENHSLEPNMEWIGCTVCEIFAF